VLPFSLSHFFTAGMRVTPRHFWRLEGSIESTDKADTSGKDLLKLTLNKTETPSLERSFSLLQRLVASRYDNLGCRVKDSLTFQPKQVSDGVREITFHGMVSGTTLFSVGRRT